MKKSFIFNKRIFTLLFILLLSFSITGCVDVGDFNLTESEEEQVVDYITAVLLKYDSRHNSRLVDTQMARELDARIAFIKELNAQQVKALDTDSSDGASSGDEGNGSALPSVAMPEGEQDLAKAFGMEGLDVSYTGYEVTSSYKSQHSEDAGIDIDAKPGKQLIVFHFEIDNNTATEQRCDFLDAFPSFQIVVNGSDNYTAMSTFLSSDLATLDTTIEAEGYVDAIVIIETAEGYEESISSLALKAKYGDRQSVIPMEL